MLQTRQRVILAGICATLIASSTKGEETGSVDSSKRILWTSSRIKGSPDPPPPYRVVNAFAQMKFSEPLAVTPAPGSSRLFVAERYGRVISFENDPKTRTSNELIDLKKVVYGLAFHPKFPENGYFFVTYVTSTEEVPDGTVVSRFQADPKNPRNADLGTEKVILKWRSGGHNGGCLKFGPDGYLYIATGDSSGIADQRLTGQDLTNLSGAILRIDVDRPTNGRAYSIPKDNPFVDLAGARGEIWAYGLRQPWKFSFDRNTGDLWTGNVGQDLWEQVFLIERGGNYGWSVMEGSHPFRPERARGPTPFVPPVVEHDHAEFRSITGGFVYHGKRLEELNGCYVYGDYDTGKIWKLRYDRNTKAVSDHTELVDSTIRLVGFAEYNNSELLLVDHVGGLLYRLEKNSQANTSREFPRQLSRTGLFSSTKDLTPAPGVIRYDVAAPQWVDGGFKQRLLAIPGDRRIEFDGITYPQPAPGAPHGWKFPDGTVMAETIFLEMEVGNRSSARRLETRILHYEELAGSEEVGDQFWRGYTYVWNEDQSDALLLEDPLGKDVAMTIKDPTSTGGKRTQTWHFPSRAECTVCHNMAAKYVLGMNTLQANRDFDYGERSDNQLRMFESLGLFSKPLPRPVSDLPHLADYRKEELEIDQRARSYLHANCSHCHRKWGGGNAEFLLLGNVDFSDMGIAETAPGHGSFYIPNAKILAPGSPYRSVLLYRMAKIGPGRMPRLGSNVVDRAGLQLVRDWIRATPLHRARPPRTPDELLAKLRTTTPAKIKEFLSTTGTAMEVALLLDNPKLPGRNRRLILEHAAKSELAHIRDLFESYLPEEQRVKRLGIAVRPEQILSLTGDAERGRQLFFEAAGVQCKSCHKVAGQGADVGPDLSQIGKKYPDKFRLLDTILNPSKEIEPKYRAYLAVTVEGAVHTGMVVKQNDDVVVLKDAKNKLTTIKADSVEQLVSQQQSMMPDLLLRDMTAQQVADLTEFLSGLK